MCRTDFETRILAEEYLYTFFKEESVFLFSLFPSRKVLSIQSILLWTIQQLVGLYYNSFLIGPYPSLLAV